MIRHTDFTNMVSFNQTCMYHRSMSHSIIDSIKIDVASVFEERIQFRNACFFNAHQMIIIVVTKGNKTAL